MNDRNWGALLSIGYGADNGLAALRRRFLNADI